MPQRDQSRQVRNRLVAALRAELLGPSSPDEVIHEFPTSRYLAGRLAPARVGEDDTDAVVDPAENDTLAVGGDDSEEGAEEPSPPLIIGFNPSSFGLSFLVGPSETELRVEISWGDYRLEKNSEEKLGWQRYARLCVVTGVRIDRNGNLPEIVLSPSAANTAGVTVTGVDDSEITLDGVIHDFAGYRAVSLFIVNRRTKGPLSDRRKDERWVFQPRLVVTSPSNDAIFVAKDFQAEAQLADDGEGAISALLFRDAREFATGHGVAAQWAAPTSDGHRTTSVYTEFIPQHEIPILIAPSEDTGGAILDMDSLSSATDGDTVARILEPMVLAYEAWIDITEKASRVPEIQNDAQLCDAAGVNIRRCKECAARIRDGLSLIRDDQRVFAAFRFANSTMRDQRIHSLWAAANRKKGDVSGSPSEFDQPGNRTWRPFQMGFILMCLRSIADESNPERRLIDLLWFPTGGGKTEAYLGLAAFTLALRRLRGDRDGMAAGAGVSIIMRYTLRLLTVQQFQRAAALICACELIRRGDPTRWGVEPFRIGIWVGRGTTPNTFVDSQKALADIADGKKPKAGSPVQLVSCPRCGIALVDEKGAPQRSTYCHDTSTQRTLVWCCNKECEFSPAKSANQGIPVVLVDDEIYRMCPTLIVATVDKFARIPFKGETRALFGLRDRYSPMYGHLTEADGDSVGNRKLRDARPAPRLLPPELIIQDELHLISGPLGTMVGLYETVVDYASSVNDPRFGILPAKVIASTATIRRAAQQTRQLYGGRQLVVFPPSGIAAGDSFFARELPIDPANDATAGRLYVGVNTPGSSTKTLLVRVYAILLAVAGAENAVDAGAADPYGTLVGYFNSLRALGGAKRVVEDDVNLARLKYLAHRRGLPRRYINDPVELTSRLDSWKIPGVLRKLDISFPRGKSDWPVDVLLATIMISVGVDIDRLGLMVVTGQPKSTAEYIQATSRVGRKHPGLVVTMYNWLGARDLSHYERFESYHSALYRYVEAISVTPFSSRALDRGLRGIFAAMNRLAGHHMAGQPDAQNFDPSTGVTTEIIENICQRAAEVVGQENAKLVRDRLLAHRDEWAHLTDLLLRYSWLDDSRYPPNNSRVLLRTSGTQNEGIWPVPGSLREVEPTAGFFLDTENDA
ncbi:MAG: DISARM system helicase DrmA [Gemmatimonadota bacterium]|nr:DISARM system helicase DrmA [Gemmatimonadota bacterium]